MWLQTDAPVLAVSCRIVLVCAKRSLYAAFSVLPYGESAHLRYRATPGRAPAPHLHVMSHHAVSLRTGVCLHHVLNMSLFVDSDPKLEAQRQRLSSVAAADLLPSLEGLELESYGKVSVHHTLGNRDAPSGQVCLNDLVSLFRRCPTLSFSIRRTPW